MKFSPPPPIDRTHLINSTAIPSSPFYFLHIFWQSLLIRIISLFSTSATVSITFSVSFCHFSRFSSSLTLTASWLSPPEFWLFLRDPFSAWNRFLKWFFTVLFLYLLLLFYISQAWILLFFSAEATHIPIISSFHKNASLFRLILLIKFFKSRCNFHIIC